MLGVVVGSVLHRSVSSNTARQHSSSSALIQRGCCSLSCCGLLLWQRESPLACNTHCQLLREQLPPQNTAGAQACRVLLSAVCSGGLSLWLCFISCQRQLAAAAGARQGTQQPAGLSRHMWGSLEQGSTRCLHYLVVTLFSLSNCSLIVGCIPSLGTAPATAVGHACRQPSGAWRVVW